MHSDLSTHTEPHGWTPPRATNDDLILSFSPMPEVAGVVMVGTLLYLLQTISAIEQIMTGSSN